MAERILGKGRTKKYVRLGALQTYDFDTFTVGAGQANTVLQTILPVPFAMKIPLVTLVGNAAIAGLTSFNICLGTAAEAGALVEDTSDTGVYTLNSTGGLCLFQNAGNTAPTDKPVTLVGNVPQTFATSAPDAIIGQNTLLTVRIVSTGGGAGTLKVILSCLPIDVKPQNPQTTVFNWATDIG